MKFSLKLGGSELLIDAFNKPTGKSLLWGDWFIFTDKPNNDASSIYPYSIMEAYAVMPFRQQNMALSFSYTLSKGTYKWELYVGLGVNI